MKPRKYTLRKRAEMQDETRARIVEATVALHEELGPRGTTISAIAERAGVQRLTVYRHFPDEVALFAACTSHWFADHPPPDPSEWMPLDAGERPRVALLALYRYYRGTERMWTVTYRDIDDVPALQAPMQGFEAYLAGMARDLAADGHRRVKALVAHCLRFSTWQSLVRQGRLSDAEGAALCARCISGERDARAGGG